MSDLFRLDGKVAVVTGATSDIGQAISRTLAQLGADLALTSREAARLAPLAEEVRRMGRRAWTFSLDLADVNQVQEVFGAIVAACGRVDVLVNNAGTILRRPSLEMTAAEWDEVMNVNLRGAFFVCQQAARTMRAAGHGGKIVNISSTHGMAAFPERAAYAVSKAALNHLTRVLAREWAPYRICVNAVAPTTTRTRTREPLLADPETYRRLVSRIPMGRPAEPPDIVGAVAFLASPASDFITGQILAVDGGQTTG